MRKFVVFFLVLLALVFPDVCYAGEVDTEKIYNDSLELLELEKQSKNLPEEAQDFLNKIDLKEPLSTAEIFSPGNIFDILEDFLKNNIKTPLRSGCLILCVLLLGAALSNFYDNNKLLEYTVSLSLAAISVLPIINVVSVCVDTLKSSGAFMLSFIPIYVSVLASSGKPITAAGFSSIMMLAVQLLTSVCSFLIIPLTGMQLSLGISGAVSGEVKLRTVSAALKKISVFSLSVVCTVFLSILGIQTAIKSPADDLYSKTAKYVVGSVVPYVGNVIGETLNTVRGCMNLLKSTVMVYGVCAIAITIIPILIQLLCWRLVLMVCGAVADTMAIGSAKELLAATDNTVAFVLGIFILIPIMFIISITLILVI